MRRPSLFALGFLCLCCLVAAPTWAETASPTATAVYVSGGPYIYNVWSDGSLHKVYDATKAPSPYGQTIQTTRYAGPYFSSLAIGPDNVDMATDGSGNAAYPFVIYACDDNKDTILRFVPTGSTANGNPPAEVLQLDVPPTCGRFTSTGDFYFTSGNSVYEVAGAANIQLGQGLWMSARYASVASGLNSLQGITQKNVGDLLLVDKTDNKVLRSAYGSFGSPSDYITSGLNAPIGIARISTGDVFVSNGGSGLSATVSHFTSAPAAAGTCPTLVLPAVANKLGFIAASETDTIYVVSSTTTADGTEDLDYESEPDSPPAAVWSWTPGQAGCGLQPVASSPTLLSGVAVAPIATNTITESISANTTAQFDFNSSEFQITPPGDCSASVSAYPLSLAEINSIIGKTTGFPGNGATPVVNLGEGGYEIGYIADGDCAMTAADAIFGFYDSSTVSNPRIVRCDWPMDDNSEPFLNGFQTCVALQTIGAYPSNGPLNADPGTVGRGGVGSLYVLVNAARASGSAGTQGNFCGFALPLRNNPVYDTDDFVPIAFQLSQNNNCTTGPFIGNAQVLLSVAQTADASGSPTFVPELNLKTVLNLGTTFPQPALCKYFPKSPLACTYGLILNLQGSGLGAGTYEASILFLTGNTSPQSFTFTVLPEGTKGTF
jgi:hypothetical protein